MLDWPNERREDWARSVDENLASLNAGQRVWEHELSQIRRLLSDIDIQLRGDPLKERSGLVGRIEMVERTLAKVDSVLFVDPSGTKGLVHDFFELKTGREDRRTNWGNFTKIMVAAIMSGVLTHFWGDISGWINQTNQDPLDQIMESAKRPKVRHRHVTPRSDLPPPASTESPDY